jgi:hypothetical protein
MVVPVVPLCLLISDHARVPCDSARSNFSCRLMTGLLWVCIGADTLVIEFFRKGLADSFVRPTLGWWSRPARLSAGSDEKQLCQADSGMVEPASAVKRWFR